jgi:hypothetical protein
VVRKSESHEPHVVDVTVAESSAIVTTAQAAFEANLDPSAEGEALRDAWFAYLKGKLPRNE